MDARLRRCRRRPPIALIRVGSWWPVFSRPLTPPLAVAVPGSHALSVLITDDQNLTASATSAFIAGTPPPVAIADASSVLLLVGGTAWVIATPNDVDGNLARVEFFQGDTAQHRHDGDRGGTAETCRVRIRFSFRFPVSGIWAYS